MLVSFCLFACLSPSLYMPLCGAKTTIGIIEVADAASRQRVNGCSQRGARRGSISQAGGAL